jgi:hypothetical protein
MIVPLAASGVLAVRNAKQAQEGLAVVFQEVVHLV